MTRVFIVDDNAVNLKLATDVLESEGLSVEVAMDAEQALTRLAGPATPDIILMDIGLPGMDGLTLTRKLKAEARFADVPVVALTASAMKGDDQKAYEAGCEGYITKPIDTRRFAAQVRAFLKRTPVTLIVDDIPVNRHLLRAGLEAEGHDVVEAADGIEALAQLEAGPIDAVVSDILMPRMDGFRLCREVRASGKSYASVPFVLYTSTYDSPGDRALAASVGANGYLLKPAPIKDLLEALKGARLSDTTGSPAPRVTENYVLEQYNAALVRKLEARNHDLQQALANLQSAHDEITALNQDLERRVEERTAALTAANEELESFSYSVAHDLRAPLRHIFGYAELASEAVASQPGELRDDLARVMRAAKQMDQLIVDLLDFSRLGRKELLIDSVELAPIVAQAVESLQPELRERSVEWRIAPLPRVRGDRALLLQVFVNLLGNAVKYTRSRERAVIEVGTDDASDGHVLVFVRDNGVGFDSSRAQKLFGVFQRMHSSADYEGTGIGLANVRRIVERHGGKVWADSQVDQGTRVTFILPGA
jgi:CheY-like chemotaxis protein